MEVETQRYRGIACYEWLAMPSGVMVKSQSELPLRVISGSIATQGQVSMLIYMPYFTMRNYETSLVWAAARGHTDVNQMCRAGPTPHWLQSSGNLAPQFTSIALQRVGPSPFLRSTVELILVVRVLLFWPQGCEERSTGLPLLCHEVAFAWVKGKCHLPTSSLTTGGSWKSWPLGHEIG